MWHRHLLTTQYDMLPGANDMRVLLSQVWGIGSAKAMNKASNIVSSNTIVVCYGHNLEVSI
jgi:hypothetical protein